MSGYNLIHVLGPSDVAYLQAAKPAVACILSSSALDLALTHPQQALAYLQSTCNVQDQHWPLQQLT